MINRHPEMQTLALLESGDLQPERSREVESHVRSCMECRNALGQFAGVREMLRETLPEPAGDDLLVLRRRVLERLNAAGAHKPLRLGWMAAAIASAAAVVVAIALVPVQPHTSPLAAEAPRFSGQLAAPPMQTRRMNEPVLVPSERPLPHYARHPVIRPATGMSSATVLVAANGSARLRIRTADPNVIILLPMDEKTNEEKN